DDVQNLFADDQSLNLPVHLPQLSQDPNFLSVPPGSALGQRPEFAIDLIGEEQFFMHRGTHRPFFDWSPLDPFEFQLLDIRVPGTRQFTYALKRTSDGLLSNFATVRVVVDGADTDGDGIPDIEEFSS